MTLADRLVELRVRRGLSQEQLAERSGVSPRTIGDLERGTTRRPQRETLRALIDALELDRAGRTDLERLARSAPPAGTRRAVRPPPKLGPAVPALIGRDRDLTAVAGLLRSRATRLITVIGPGGVGKSRLAREAGRRAAPAFDQVSVADLSALDHPDTVGWSIAAAAGCAVTGRDPMDDLAGHLAGRRWLLVLDGFDRVPGAAGTVAELLARCPALTVLAAGRAPLSLRGEHLWPLAPLPASEPGAAVSLLVERAAAARPGFRASPGTVRAVTELCRRLDGLPLAIELAAVWLRTREPGELLAELPDRPVSLPETVRWSLGRLADPERAVLGLLAVFAGGATPAAVRAVLDRSGRPPSYLDGSVATLAATGLITVADHDGTARISMPGAVREVAAGLPEEGARAAHAGYFLDALRHSTGPDRLTAEIANCRTALGWAVEHRPELLDVALVRASTGFFRDRAMIAEGLRTLRAMAEVAPDEAAAAWALHGAALAAYGPEAVELAGRSAALFDRRGDDAGRCSALTVLGAAQQAVGDYAGARTSQLAALALGHQAAVSLNHLGDLAHEQGDLEAAREHYLRSLALGDDPGARLRLAGVATDLGRYAEAYEQLGAAGLDTPRALALLAEALTGLGRLGEAADHAHRALDLARQTGDRSGAAVALARLGEVALARGDFGTAATLLHEALDDAAGPREQARILNRLTRTTAAARAEHRLIAD